MATENLTISIRADDTASATLKNTRNQIDAVGRSAKATSTQVKALGNASGRMRGVFGGLGYQIQDVAVQLQSGQNAMLVFGQQGSQIASLFGPAGAVVGALIAVGAAIGTALLPKLFAAEKGFADLRKEAESFGADLRTLAPLLFADQIKKMNDEIEVEQGRLAEIEADIARVQQRILDRPKRRGGALQLKRDQDAISAYQREAEKARVSIAKLTADRDKLNAVTTEEAELPKDPMADRIKSMREQASRIKDLNDPLRVYKRQIQEIQLLVSNGFLTDEEGLAQIDRLGEKFKNFQEQVPKAAESVKKWGMTMDEFKTGALGNLEDGLVSLIEGTKSVSDAFKDMARQVVSSLIRMAIQQSVTAPLAQAFGLAGAKANGGMVGGGQSYLVGERGPEVFTPGTSGRISPSHQSGGSSSGSGVVVNQTINVTTGVQQTVRTEIANLMPQIANASKAAVLDARKRGGSYAGAFG